MSFPQRIVVRYEGQEPKPAEADFADNTMLVVAEYGGTANERVARTGRRARRGGDDDENPACENVVGAPSVPTLT